MVLVTYLSRTKRLVFYPMSGASLPGARSILQTFCLTPESLRAIGVRENKLEASMNRSVLVLFLLLAIPVSAQQPPEIRYHSVPDFLKLPPDVYFGEVPGVAVNSKGHIFVFTRGNSAGPAYAASAAQLLEFAPDSKFLREIGHNLYAWSFAHAVKVDKGDNIWAVDKGSDMVIKFNPEGRVVLVFGRKQEASDEGTAPLKHPKPPLPPVDGMFRQVTDVSWDAAGNAYVTDGYINSRVAKIDKDGNWLKSWGEPGDQPGQFNLPHSIAVDARDAIGNKPTATTGTMAPGSPWSICITPGPNQVLYSSDAFPGRVYKLSLDGKVLGMFGKAGKQLGQFGWIHEMACPSENELYVSEILNWRVQKLVLEPSH